MKEKKHLIDKIEYLKQIGMFPLLLRFVTVNAFHIGFEMLITVYSVELFVFLTDFFLEDSITETKIFSIILIPIVIALLAALSYLIYSVFYFVDKAYDHVSSCVKEKNSFKKLFKKYNKEVKKVHSIGIILYLIVSFLISIWISRKHGSINSCSTLIICSCLICFVLGFIWNATGYARNQRIFWDEYLNNIKISQPEKQMLAVINFKCYVWNLVGNVISFLFIFVLNTVTFLNIHEEVGAEKITTDYWFIIIYLFSIIYIYAKTIYSLLYSEKNICNNKAGFVFPSLSTIIKKYQSVKKEQDQEEKSQ